MSTFTRIVPSAWLDLHRPQRMVERAAVIYRRLWLIFISGFFEPLFFLLSIRIGLAALVGDVEVDGQMVPYDRFVAPALLATSAMNGAIYDTTMNLFHKLKYSRAYDAVLSSPMTAGDVALGEILAAVIRGGIYSAAFLAVMWAMGLVVSGWVVLAVPIALLIAFTFGALGMALTTYMRSWADFEFVPPVTLMFMLFSATFYPLSTYGEWSWLVQLSPLYHGVVLVRGVAEGNFDPAMIAHIGVLVGLALAGLTIAARRVERLLLA